MVQYVFDFTRRALFMVQYVFDFTRRKNRSYRDMEQNNMLNCHHYLEDYSYIEGVRN